MPGSTAATAARSAAAVTRPASRIKASRAGLLTSMPSSCRSRMSPPLRWLQPTARDSGDEPAQGHHRPGGDLLDRPCRIDSEEDALVGIEGDQRLGLLGIDVKPVPDRLLAVIVPLEQLAAAVVAAARTCRGLKQDVPDPPADPARPAAGQPPDNLVVIDHEFQYDVQPGIPLGEQLAQVLGLGNVAREPV